MNNAVYKTGFASRQAVYDEHVSNLFKMLDELEKILSGNGQDGQQRDYLVGEGKGVFTEADLRYTNTISYAHEARLKSLSPDCT